MDEARAPAGAVTIRQLARETSSVIEWVREKEKPMLITRHGVPIAMIQPLEFEPWRAQARPPTGLPQLEEPEIDWDELDLNDRERLVLPLLRETFHVEDIGRGAGLAPGDAAMSCAILEIKKLSLKTLMGYRLTKLGRRVQQALQNENAAIDKGDSGEPPQ